ncbi:MAG: dihydrodipicolinate synthase family protein [Bacillota bacterium]
MAQQSFKGIIPAMVTAFNADGSVDWHGNRALLEFVVKSGVHGVLVLGSIGEFAHMSVEERKRYAEFAVETVAGRVPVLVGTASSGTREPVELSRHAISAGADGVVVVTPYYWTLSEENVYWHYAAVAREVDGPVVLYNFPALTGNPLSASLVTRLAKDFPNIVGIKDTIDSIGHVRQLILEAKSVNPEFSVLVGYDDHLLNNLAMGGDGALCGTPNFAPQVTLGIYRSYNESDFAQAVELHRKLMVLMGIYSLGVPAISAIKVACELCGLPVKPHVRGPAVDADSRVVARVKELLKEAELL